MCINFVFNGYVFLGFESSIFTSRVMRVVAIRTLLLGINITAAYL